MELYDELSRVLTDFENGDNETDTFDLYHLLVKIQNNWDVLVEEVL